MGRTAEQDGGKSETSEQGDGAGNKSARDDIIVLETEHGRLYLYLTRGSESTLGHVKRESVRAKLEQN